MPACWDPVRIVDIRERSVPLHGAPSNAVVSFSGHTVSLVCVVSDVVRDGRPVVGVAFNSIGRHAQGGILRDRMIPRVLDADPDTLLGEHGIDPAAVLAAAVSGEKPGGHGDRSSAAAALELACWDLNAKLRDEPAYITIADAFGRTPAAGVMVYAAGGYYGDGAGLRELRDEVASHLDAGYAFVKMKVGGAVLPEDTARVEAAVEAAGDGALVAVDANGRFDRTEALACAGVLRPFGLRWLEEPGDPLDYELTRSVIEHSTGAVATGENLFSLPDVENLLRYGGMRPGIDVFQMDAGLSYGLTHYARMIERLESQGHSLDQVMPHGGHLINLHIVTAFGLGGCEAYPGVFAPFGGYGPRSRPVDGRIAPTDDPGFGLEEKPDLAAEIAAMVG